MYYLVIKRLRTRVRERENVWEEKNVLIFFPYGNQFEFGLETTTPPPTSGVITDDGLNFDC